MPKLESYPIRNIKTIPPPENSWIAQVLNDHGKTRSKSPARKGDYKYPCPNDARPKLEKVLKELKMI